MPIPSQTEHDGTKPITNVFAQNSNTTFLAVSLTNLASFHVQIMWENLWSWRIFPMIFL